VKNKRNNFKKIIFIILLISGLITTSFLLINTKIFKPSLGSRIVRTTLSYFIAPIFVNDKENPLLIREKLESIFRHSLMPHGTNIEEITIQNMKILRITASGVNKKSKKTILYFHGGVWFAGSRNSHGELAARISASSGLPVFFPEYRLAPENKFPAANEDCMKAYYWLIAHGYKPKNIALAGDSVGGALVLMTILSLRDSGKPVPGAAVILSPLTDVVNYDGETLKTKRGIDPLFRHPEDIGHYMSFYISESDRKLSLLSPVRENLKGLPPMLIQVGSDEILLSDSTRLAERAKKAGVDVTIEVWENMFHVFQQAFPIINPEAREAIDNIGKFLKEKM
jgi:epsilon-lactone hydrolase